MQLRLKIERLREVRAYVNARTDIGGFKAEWLEALSEVIAAELKREGAHDYEETPRIQVRRSPQAPARSVDRPYRPEPAADDSE